MSITQQQIADHLDLDQSAVSRFLEQLEIDWRVSTMDQIRLSYVRKLRAQAAGHRSESGLDLIGERVMTERVDRELKMYTLAEKKGLLINVAQLEQELQQMVGAFKSELLGRDDKLKADLDALFGIDVDVQVLNDYTNAALNHLARYDIGEQGVEGEAVPTVAAGGENGADGLGAKAPETVG